MDKPQLLYHGSPVRLTRLEPRPARGVGPEHDQLTAVYATHRRNLAIAFAMAPATGSFGFEVTLKDDGIPQIRYIGGQPNAGGTGYLYYLPAGTFEHLTGNQWVSFSPVEPLACEEIRVDDYLSWVTTLAR